MSFHTPTQPSITHPFPLTGRVIFLNLNWMVPQGLNMRELVFFIKTYRSLGWASSTPGSRCAPASHAHLILFYLSCSFCSWALSTFPLLWLAFSSSFHSANPIYPSSMNLNIISLGILFQTCLSCINSSPFPRIQSHAILCVSWHNYNLTFVWSLGYVCFASRLWVSWRQGAHLFLHLVSKVWKLIGPQRLLVG